MSSATDECRRPRFFYGRVERVIDGKRGYQICLVDMKTEQVAWFRYRSQLAAAVGQLVSKVPAESETHYLRPLDYSRKVTSELEIQSVEDWIEEEDQLADRRSDLLPMDLLSGFAIRHDHVRDFRKIELDDLFRESLSERGMDGSVEVQDLEIVEEEVASFQREPESIEREDALYDPFFTADDFSSDIGQVPAVISAKHKFLDVSALAAQSKAAKEDLDGLQKEVEIVLHPEMAEAEKRSHGWTGMIDSGPVEMDDYLQESVLR
jgi:hypothetical protein